MIVYFPLAFFVWGALVAYGSSGRRRQIATIVMALATAWSLALLVNQATASWVAGSVLATAMLPRPRERLSSTFEVLTRRTLTIAGLVVAALVASAQLPMGENPLGLNAVPWLLGAVGTAWVISPVDARERLQGQVLMIAAAGAVILSAVPDGPVTAAAAGAMSIMPVVGQRGLGRRQWLSPLTAALAAAAAMLALSGIVIPRQSAGDLTLSVSGPVILGCAVVLAAAALPAAAGAAWTGWLGALALLAVAPALRWSAIAALVALATINDRNGERPAWLAVVALSAVPVLHGLAPPSWSARFQTVALGLGLVLMVYAARAGLLRAVALPAIGFLEMISVSTLSSGNLTRFQWIAASGALVLVAGAVLRRSTPQTPPFVAAGESVLMGLLLFAISARDALGLGALASALLLIDLSMVRTAVLGLKPGSLPERMHLLARSNWPPSVTFAGVVLAVIAALQASLALGMLAAVLLAALQITPLIDGSLTAPAAVRRGSIRAWVASVVSLAAGLAPAIVLRMLRL